MELSRLSCDIMQHLLGTQLHRAKFAEILEAMRQLGHNPSETKEILPHLVSKGYLSSNPFKEYSLTGAGLDALKREEHNQTLHEERFRQQAETNDELRRIADSAEALARAADKKSKVSLVVSIISLVVAVITNAETISGKIETLFEQLLSFFP